MKSAKFNHDLNWQQLMVDCNCGITANDVDPYQILGITPDASPVEIDAAFQRALEQIRLHELVAGISDITQYEQVVKAHAILSSRTELQSASAQRHDPASSASPSKILFASDTISSSLASANPSSSEVPRSSQRSSPSKRIPIPIPVFLVLALIVGGITWTYHTVGGAVGIYHPGPCSGWNSYILMLNALDTEYAWINKEYNQVDYPSDANYAAWQQGLSEHIQKVAALKVPGAAKEYHAIYLDYLNNIYNMMLSYRTSNYVSGDMSATKVAHYKIAEATAVPKMNKTCASSE